MNSVYELIAFFLQRGSYIERINSRKEKQRHFCQDTHFRSPPTEVALYVQCTYGGISISVSNMFDGFVGALEVAFKGFDMRSFHKMKFALSYKGEVTRYKVLLKLQTDPSYFIVWVCTHLLLRQHTRQTMNG